LHERKQKYVSTIMPTMAEQLNHQNQENRPVKAITTYQETPA